MPLHCTQLVMVNANEPNPLKSALSLRLFKLQHLKFENWLRQNNQIKFELNLILEIINTNTNTLFRNIPKQRAAAFFAVCIIPKALEYSRRRSPIDED